jgi:hypothetical protein
MHLSFDAKRPQKSGTHRYCAPEGDPCGRPSGSHPVRDDVWAYLPEKTPYKALASLIERIIDPPADNVSPI